MLGGYHIHENAQSNVLGESILQKKSYDAAIVSYCIDMSEDMLKLECQSCNMILPRGSFSEHKC